MKTLVQQTIFDVNDKNRHKEVEHIKQYHIAVITSTLTICVHFIYSFKLETFVRTNKYYIRQNKYP